MDILITGPSSSPVDDMDADSDDVDVTSSDDVDVPSDVEIGVNPSSEHVFNPVTEPRVFWSLTTLRFKPYLSIIVSLPSAGTAVGGARFSLSTVGSFVSLVGFFVLLGGSIGAI